VIGTRIRRANSNMEVIRERTVCRLRNCTLMCTDFGQFLENEKNAKAEMDEKFK
jgi:hypothetical protein